MWASSLLELVVLGHLLRVTHHFDDHHVVSVGEDKGPLFPEGAVVGPVQEESVLVDELFLGLLKRQFLKAALLLEAGEYLRLYPHEVAFHRRRLDLEAGKVPIVVDGVEEALMVDAEMGPDKGLLKLRKDRFVEKGDLKKEILLQYLPAHAELPGHEADGGNAASLAVAAVVHLDGGLEDVAAPHGYGAGKTGNAATPLFRVLAAQVPK